MGRGVGRRSARLWFLLVVGIAVLFAGVALWWRPGRTGSGTPPALAALSPNPARTAVAVGTSRTLRVDPDQQAAIGLRTEVVRSAPVVEALESPARIAPDESRFAFITPRASGVVRSVAGQIGQEVKAGDVLAILDSSEVAQARLELVTRVQDLEIARAKAEWQEAIYRSTNELIERLQAGDSPEEIHQRFQNRPIGETREKLISAYASSRLAKLTADRSQELHARNAIALSQYQEALAAYESAAAVYEGLMDRMGYETTLAYTQSHQALRQAETAVRVAIERLRVLGLSPQDASMRSAQERIKVAHRPPETLKEETLRADKEASDKSPTEATLYGDQPVSTYELRAPFDGTILDRGVVVPGVAVDTTHQLFTIANLSTVWIEASIHESDFAKLDRSRSGRVTIRSRAYPDREFVGKVLYTGDLVDEKSRMVKLLAVADNPDRALKPGMFVQARIATSLDREAPQVPESAVLSDGDKTFVFVRSGPGQFERRDVVLGAREGGHVVILRGVAAGESVVTSGGVHLKSELIRLAGL